MRREVKQSLRKALSILLIFAGIFLLAQRKWLFAIGVLLVAYLVLGDGEPPVTRPPTDMQGF
ncbi:MAG: hypothetical protein WBH35_10565 [Bacillota bacterium]|mgnify:CR=1 FL=1|jgi:hypothetical protein|nr:hypothetical protein [Bacillota bacterium]HOB91368.1 hypothetical protein [Bacillota bacterium]HPZ54777.1 hypothetical protein [Bacillota bacterium]HQD18589.1 hypothetical protein [Bacillota bacterium]